MTIEEFTKKYTSAYSLIFENQEETTKEIIEEKVDVNTLSKIAKFLFEPRYEVNNLQFKSVS